MADEAVMSWKPWSVSMGTPCAESRLIEKPQEKRPPLSSQKDGRPERVARWPCARSPAPPPARRGSGALPSG